MTGLYTSARFFARHGDAISAIEQATGATFERIPVPDEDQLDPAAVERIEIAFFANDLINAGPVTRRFFGAVRRAPNLRWIHAAHAGTDAPVYQELLAKGVRVTTSSGDAAVPIAQTAIGALLMLARGYPRWLDAQRRHAWEPHRGRLPRDLEGQVMIVIGVGAIGNEVARLARALGMHVIGVRRSPQRPEDHVDEMHPPAALSALYPRADWVAIACPLTPETRGLIDAAAIAALPEGARVLNVARGEVVDEAALTAALAEGRLAGAYLDVFHEEPLPADSPLWDLPNVIVTPHNSSTSAGYGERTVRRYLRNLEHWVRGEPLEQEV
ncbi:MAG: D-2-hydroxyacid dehydrogenase [Chloroflexi bacterium]|nr:D-2-hydroxyacid dehydrogenase [Chloroflexota bacterium]